MKLKIILLLQGFLIYFLFSHRAKFILDDTSTKLYDKNSFTNSVVERKDFNYVFIQPGDGSNQVGQFEKLEIGMAMPATIAKQVNNFILNDTIGINPFDPEQISIEAIFKTSTQQDTVFGFYYEGFIRDSSTFAPFQKANWIHQPTNYNWRIRFSPPTIGTWHCLISVYLKNEKKPVFQSNDIEFTCSSSANKGYLKKGNDNRHLAYSGSNESFFALGQVLAWNDADEIGYGIPYFRGGPGIFPDNPTFHKLYHAGMLDMLDGISDLKDQGGNMVRTAIVPWGFDFEFEKLNNYSNRMNRAWELDQLIQMCDRRDLKLSLDFQFFSTGNSNPNFQFNWASNPYSKIPGVNDASDFLNNSTAKKIFKNKLRYFMSRWGYSTSLGILTLTGEIDGWRYKGKELKNNDAAQTSQYNWYKEMLFYTKHLVNYRPILMTTSYGGTSGRDYKKCPFNLDDMDITTLHLYNTERSANISRRFNELNNSGVEKGMLVLWPDKPTYFQEIGLADYGADPNDIEACSDISFHNTLWSTAFMGGFGTGFPWWNQPDYRRLNFPALNSFFKGIDFQKNYFVLPAVWDNSKSFDFNHSTSTIEVFYTNSKRGDYSIGWVHNSTYWWGNIDLQCKDRNGKTMKMPSDNDAPSSPQPIPANTKFEIHGLNNLSEYEIEYYLTRNSGGIFNEETIHSNIFGTLKPEWKEKSESADFAFKINPGRNSLTDFKKITSDTLFCSEDTIHANGNYFADVFGNFHYHWNFGNGQQSDERNALAVYNYPGTFLVTLTITDSLGKSIEMKQYIIKPSSTKNKTQNYFALSSFSTL